MYQSSKFCGSAGRPSRSICSKANLANGIVRGPRMAVGQGPIGNMRADSFYIDRDKHIIVLNGNVHMTLYPNAMKSEKKKT